MTHQFYLSKIETPLGLMVAVAHDEGLLFLEFSDREERMDRLHRIIPPGVGYMEEGSTILKFLKTELDAYFSGVLKTFATPSIFYGSCFQKKAWEELKNIPFGETTSYAQQASACGHKKAIRAIANANGQNPLAIIVPCHRVIRSDGSLGGYGGGIHRKKWLLEHENKVKKF